MSLTIISYTLELLLLQVMNYLAHLFLSGESAAVKAGNLFGDEIKGRDFSYLPAEVEIGVKLHRFIDDHADNHSLNLEMKKMLHPHFHKYAGVALDIYYDHFLSVHWSDYSDYSLERFTDEVYSEMDDYVSLFSSKSNRLFESMKKYRWLAGYGDMDGMIKTFNGIKSLTREDSGLEKGVEVLQSFYEPLDKAFKEYFPELVEESSQKLVALSFNRIN